MNFFDFMYLVEKGDIVNPQQALSATDAKQQVENGNWFTFFKHTTVYGKNINAAEYMKSIPTIQRIYDMGLVKPNGGLMTSDDITSLLQQKKDEEQRIRLERAHSYQVEKPILEIRTSEKGSEDNECLQINMYSFLQIKKEPSEMLSSFFN